MEHVSLAVSNGSPIDCNISHLLSRECILVWRKGRLAGNSLNVCNNFRLGQLILRSSDPVRLKIEGGVTNIETTQNGSTEVLGGTTTITTFTYGKEEAGTSPHMLCNDVQLES